MTPRIAIVDYGMGNLRSVEKALQKVGATVDVTDSPARLRSAQAAAARNNALRFGWNHIAGEIDSIYRIYLAAPEVLFLVSND